MGSYDEMKSRGSFNEATRTKQDGARARTAAERRAEERRQEALAWVRESLPELGEKFRGHAAAALLRNDHLQLRRSAQAVKLRMSVMWPWLVEVIRESKGEET